MTRVIVILALLAAAALAGIWLVLRRTSNPEWMDAYEPPADESWVGV